jgi:hypothetical protein
MKRQHNPNPPPWYIPRAVVVPADYEDQVQRSTEKLERAYARAQKRVERAKASLAQAKQEPITKKNEQLVAQYQALLDIRLAELENYRRMMCSVPASAIHRGTRSFRPVPNRESSSLIV